MPYMAVGHDEVVAAHHGLAARCGATVYGNALAERIVVTNLARSLLAMELKVLRHSTNHGVGEDTVVGSHAGTPAYGGAIHNLAAVANDHIIFNGYEGTNLNTFTNLGSGRNRGHAAYFAICRKAHRILM